eukprot:TRINITY_DN23347_c0_g1_i3.p1 TRINITY_DN23347_c0_g1~~TRINITY_DN23347_c0_g1_i3.p1  ORF type:complete len:478 (+),score=78.00 TRINITY_DN23347_c0_g1_i3:89-1522(+)
MRLRAAAAAALAAAAVAPALLMTQLAAQRTATEQPEPAQSPSPPRQAVRMPSPAPAAPGAVQLRRRGDCGGPPAERGEGPHVGGALAARVARQARQMTAAVSAALPAATAAAAGEAASRGARLGSEPVDCCPAAAGGGGDPAEAGACAALRAGGCAEPPGLPLGCGLPATPWRGCAELRLLRPLHWGGKTALYLGELHGRRVGVKHFPLQWYETFAGFHTLGVSRRRHRWMNFPTWACLHSAPGGQRSVFQAQPLLAGPDLTRWRFPPAEEDGAQWGARLGFMLRIACIFRWLHAHPLGPFSFDDNHPAQYVVHEGGPVMVDLDTVRRCSAAGYARCRCFACKGGRANCVFPNSPEGFSSCKGGGSAAEEPLCGVRTDMWFLGLLFWSMLPGSSGVPLSGVHPKKLGPAVVRGKRPAIGPGVPPQLTALLQRCWSDPGARPSSAEAVDALQRLCAAHGCATGGCPAEHRDPEGYTAG